MAGTRWAWGQRVAKHRQRNSRAAARADLAQRFKEAVQRRRVLTGRAYPGQDSTWSTSWLGGSGAYGVSGAYNITDPRRTIAEGGTIATGSANQILAGGLGGLIRYLRQMERNNSSLRAMIEAYKARWIGTGITVLPDTGDVEIDKRLAEVWNAQAEHLGTDGESDMELQRLWTAEYCTSGNPLGRIVNIEDRLDEGLVPLAVLPLEMEWLLYDSRPKVPDGHNVVCGVEADKYCRRVRWHIRNPETGGKVEAVDREFMIHAIEKRRARQTVGEPALAIIIERALQRARLIDAELQSAINASSYSTYLKSDSPDDEQEMEDTDTDSDGNAAYITEVPIGVHANLMPGDDLEVIKTERPNTDVGVFAGSLNGDMAAAGGSSRIDLDRDGSAYNFANARFDQIHQNMRTKPAQKWFGHQTMGRIYREYLPYVTLLAGVPWPKDPAQQRRLAGYKLAPDIPPEHDEKSAAMAFKILYEKKATNLREWYSRRGEDWRKELAQFGTEQSAIAELVTVDMAEEVLKNAAK